MVYNSFARTFAVEISRSQRVILALFVALFASLAAAVQPVIVKGSDFVNSQSGDRFEIIGVAYQPGGASGYNPGSDPLSDGKVCLRDAAIMQNLGVNTIRVYNVDPTINHDECASIFNSVGIYMILDVNSPLVGQSLNRDQPWTSYYSGYLQRVFSVIEAFKNYPNTLGFFAGNEVINDDSNAQNVPQYIRAVQRDMKNYIAKHCDRAIPVGYSAADVRDILQDTWAYLQCSISGDDNNMSRSDFFGLNSYSWCGGDATFESAGYNTLVEMFASTTVPVFFSEYGCNQVKPRVFDEVQALYGPQMTVLSGGLVYEYSQEPSDYGLVVINNDGSVNLRTDFDNLQSQFNKLNVTLLESSNNTATALNPPTCSADLITSSSFSTDFTLPQVPPGGQDLIDNGIQNPNQGKLVDVQQTSPSQTVYGSNGSKLNNLAISPLPSDQSNHPSGEKSSGSSSSSAATSSTSSSGSSSTSTMSTATSSTKPTGTANSNSKTATTSSASGTPSAAGGENAAGMNDVKLPALVLAAVIGFAWCL
ncbi:glycoside hydrolase family 72 protein [Xylona heveae TC161]|uniref:1,3-beta-glucanosyltransferase n=1 Tax=Xylona heveae (strain CBS 132557 / TC161) TaxID=1328760 RepID=A0A164ZQ95_XYLHT|nr:glycoside hydrolase family 72 protein [Xylona heveae TC161]KZF19370.1 glycoside hydrolase family 72 protein [Xylona heveae TC161]